MGKKQTSRFLGFGEGNTTVIGSRPRAQTVTRKRHFALEIDIARGLQNLRVIGSRSPDVRWDINEAYMELKMQPGLPQFLRDENGHLPTWMRPTIGLSSSHEKPLGRRGSQPDSSRERLLQYADIFTAAATYKLKLGRDGAEKTIWLQREDLSNRQTR